MICRSAAGPDQTVIVGHPGQTGRQGAAIIDIDRRGAAQSELERREATRRGAIDQDGLGDVQDPGKSLRAQKTDIAATAQIDRTATQQCITERNIAVGGVAIEILIGRTRPVEHGTGCHGGRAAAIEGAGPASPR